MAKKRKNYSYRRKVVIKPGSYRSRQKNRKLGKFFVYLVLLSALGVLLYAGGRKLVAYAYTSEKIMVKDIEVAGCKNVTKTEIKELLPFKIGDNMLKLNLSEAEEEIRKVKPELKDISISRRWQKIKVKLYERVPEAFVKEQNELLGIDFDNKPFPLRGFMSGMQIPVIYYRTEEERAGLLGFIKKFKTVSGDFMGNICEISFSNCGDIVFKTYDGAVIFWGDERTEYMSHKFDKLQKIYADSSAKYKNIEYIDMTFYGLGKAVVKPREEVVEPVKPAKII